jgi:hypothetical protein
MPPWASLGIFDGEHFRALATHGFQERIASQVRQPFRPHRYMRPLVDGARLIIEPDLQALNSNDRVVHGVVAAGARTTLVVPLRKDGNLVGYISEFRREVRLFSETEIALLTTFAAQAVIAMDNARLITEQREALEQQTATAEVLQVINASPGNLAPVFDAMREKAMRLCDAAFGNFSTYDGEAFECVAARGVPSAFAEFLREPIRVDSEHPRSALIQIIHGAEVVHDADLADDEMYRSGIGSRRSLVDLGGART